MPNCYPFNQWIEAICTYFKLAGRMIVHSVAFQFMFTFVGRKFIGFASTTVSSLLQPCRSNKLDKQMELLLDQFRNVPTTLALKH